MVLINQISLMLTNSRLLFLEHMLLLDFLIVVVVSVFQRQLRELLYSMLVLIGLQSYDVKFLILPFENFLVIIKTPFENLSIIQDV